MTLLRLRRSVACGNPSCRGIEPSAKVERLRRILELACDLSLTTYDYEKGLRVVGRRVLSCGEQLKWAQWRWVEDSDVEDRAFDSNGMEPAPLRSDLPDGDLICGLTFELSAAIRISV